MNKTQAKKLIKDEGLYGALYALAELRHCEALDLVEIFERVLDEIPDEILYKAIKKGTR